MKAAANISSSKGVHWLKKSGLLESGLLLTGVAAATTVLAVQVLKDMFPTRNEGNYTSSQRWQEFHIDPVQLNYFCCDKFNRC